MSSFTRCFSTIQREEYQQIRSEWSALKIWRWRAKKPFCHLIRWSILLWSLSLNKDGSIWFPCHPRSKKKAQLSNLERNLRKNQVERSLPTEATSSCQTRTKVCWSPRTEASKKAPGSGCLQSNAKTAWMSLSSNKKAAKRARPVRTPKAIFLKSDKPRAAASEERCETSPIL